MSRGRLLTTTSSAHPAPTSGANILRGGEGDDRLNGGSRDDILDGRTGANRLRGGADRDTFIIQNDGETDTILDFQNGLDLIDPRSSGVGLLDQLFIEQSGLHTTILIAGSLAAAVVVENVAAGLFDTSDFIFN